MHACSVSGITFALAMVTLSDVRDVTPTIEFLRHAAALNLGAGSSSTQAFTVPGTTPNTQAGRVAFKGKRPDGSAVTEHLLLFAHGARVYQASVVGDAPDESAVAAFFGGLAVVR